MTRSTPLFAHTRWLLALAIALAGLSSATLSTPPAVAQEGGSDADETDPTETDTNPTAGEADEGSDPVNETSGNDDPSDPADETAPSTTEAGGAAGVGAQTGGTNTNTNPAATEQRLREMATQVDEFKEETFGTKSRLLLLREQVLRRTIAGSKLIVYHVNDMGSEYELVQVLYALDRQRQFSRIDYSGELAKLNDKVVVDQTVVPGSHVLMVEMVFKGDPWFLFQYHDGYTFTVRSSYLFEADEGKLHEIAVVAKEDGDFFTPLEERPTIVYEESTYNIADDNSDSAPAAAATP